MSIKTLHLDADRSRFGGPGGQRHLPQKKETGASGVIAYQRINDTLSRLGEIDASPRAPDLGNPHPIACPCCRQLVKVPTLEIVIDRYSLTPTQAKVLTAVWHGRGLPVSTERIFDVMYADDPDGGPSGNAMYSAFKIALCRLRKRLEGSGVSVETVGYGRGFRLVLGEW